MVVTICYINNSDIANVVACLFSYPIEPQLSFIECFLRTSYTLANLQFRVVMKLCIS